MVLAEEQTHRSMGQTREPKTDPDRVSDKGAKSMHWGRTAFSTNVLELLDIHKQKTKTKQNKKTLNFTSYTETNSKWVTDLNVQHKTVRTFLDLTPKA